MEMVVGVIAFMMQDQIAIMLTRTFNQTIHEYETDPVAAATIDALQNEVFVFFRTHFLRKRSFLLFIYYNSKLIQEQFYCCGGQGPDDWLPVVGTTKDSDIILPTSCCAIYEEDENVCLAIKRMGCLPQLTYLLDQSSLLLTTTVLMIALMQVKGKSKFD